MTPRNVRLLLADVDGTLLNENKELTQAATAAAHSLDDAGILLAITSGRPPRGMDMLVEPLRLKSIIAGFNGGCIVNPDLSAIKSHPLEPDAAGDALKLIVDQRLDAWVYTDKEWLIRDADAPHVAHEAWTVKFDPTVTSGFTDAHLAHVLKIVGVSDDSERMAACERAAQDILGDRASATRSQPYYLDVTSRRANKGEVVSTLSALLDISREEIATIGDMPNDVLMFVQSGFAIAMGNASNAVRNHADVVTDSNENDGFAKAVHRFLLRRDLQ